ncbi:MAG: hypothetical protein ABFD00_09600 [Chloroherpetonaceae bacterium]|nr:hypothetical protein [bacterium]
MNRITIISLALLMLFAVSCKQEPATIEEDKYINEVISDTSYFPLDIGNEWIYDISYDTVNIHLKVIDSAYFNSLKYSVVLCENYQGKFAPVNLDTMYLRTTDGIKFYRYINGAERLYLDFSQDFTDSIKGIKYSVSIPENSYGIPTGVYSIPLGEFQDCKKIESIEVEPRIYISAKGIGMISFTWFKGKATLIYAKINGTEIGA